MDTKSLQGMHIDVSMAMKENKHFKNRMKSVYHFECLDADGNLKWEEKRLNIVVDTGLNDLLDKYFKGSAYTAAWYVGLKAGGSATAADTISGHPAWLEFSNYSAASRPTLTLGTVSGKSVDNSANKAVFDILTATSVAGAFVVNNATKGGASGILYGAVDFSSPRSVAQGDTLNVTVTLATSAT